MYEYENLTVDVFNEGMMMCEIFQVNILPKKLLLFWSDYGNMLKYKDLILQELINYIRTEDVNRFKDKLI